MTQITIQLDRHQLAAQFKQRARLAGFDLVGIASAEPSKYQDYYRQWLEDGQHGSMEYLAKRFDERMNPSVYLPGARSVICVAINYHVPLERVDPSEVSHHGKIARYALGDDYHELIKSRLHELADWIRQQSPGVETKTCVDTAPVNEKELAARAGIGWLGKNACIINQEIGSWLLLGEIVTTLELPHDEPAIDRCGTCRRCIDACPTGAITGPYRIDARKCISYLTIEHRGEIDPELKPGIGHWLYGCDICQDVCPWNRKAPVGKVPVRAALVNPALEWLAEMDSAAFKRWFAGSPLERTRKKRIQRNVAIAMGNSGEAKFLPKLREWAAGEDAVLAEAARWAMTQISESASQ